LREAVRSAGAHAREGRGRSACYEARSSQPATQLNRGLAGLNRRLVELRNVSTKLGSPRRKSGARLQSLIELPGFDRCLRSVGSWNYEDPPALEAIDLANFFKML
jgi:hypothetical protein